MATSQSVYIEVDEARVLALLRKGGKRMAFAVVNALNKTAKAVQAEQRKRVRQTVTVRKTKFIDRTIASIRKRGGGSGFASVKLGRYEARIAIDDKPRLLLEKLEHGGERAPFTQGARRMAVPVPGGPARRTQRSSVPREFTYRALRLRSSSGKGRKRKTNVTFSGSVTRSGKLQWKGKNRTFVLHSTARAPEGGVFQRTGPGRDDIRMVYSFRRKYRLRQRLQWMRTGRRVVERTMQPELRRQVQNTLRYQLGLQ